MINIAQNNQNNKIHFTEICSNFATVLHRTHNIQVAANYIHLIADQPVRQMQKHKSHSHILNWQDLFIDERCIFKLQNIGDQKSSELFSLSCSRSVDNLINYYLSKCNDERYTLRNKRQQSITISCQRLQKRKNYLASIRIAWLSAPIIMADKSRTLDMLKQFWGENYFAQTSCNCEVNIEESSNCQCSEKIEYGFYFLHYLAKYIKKNILNHYNNAQFTFKISQLRKIKQFAQNQLKYQKKDVSKIFSMTFQSLSKQKNVQKYAIKGKSIENSFYEYQEQISEKLLNQLERQQEEQKAKKQKQKTKKSKKVKNRQENILIKAQLKEEKKRLNDGDYKKSKIISNEQTKKDGQIKESQILQKYNNIILKSKKDKMMRQQDKRISIIKRQEGNMTTMIQQESTNQICTVMDTSKLETNSNTPSNSCLENTSQSSEKAQKQLQIIGEEYQKQMNPQVQAQNINQNVINGIIKSKMKDIQEQLQESYGSKMIALDQITKSIRDYYPFLNFRIFGSTVNGLALPHSDLDILIENSEYYIYQEPDLLKSLGKILNKEYWVSEYQYLSTAKVPVIKLQIDLSFFLPQESFNEKQHKKLKVDITLNNIGIINSGLQSSQLMQYILTYGPNLKEAILMMKILLEKYNLHENYTGGLNSYTLFIMVISYVEYSKLNIYEKSPASILIKVIQFYAEQFDFQRYVIRYQKDSDCFVKFQEYAQKIGSQSLQKSGLLKVIDPVNNQLIKASYCELYQVIALFKTLNEAIANLKKKTLEVIEMLILQKNRVDNNIILKIAEQTVEKSQESSCFSSLFF